jgi:glycosyltransferase involved in cell wall biosynthesis
MRILINTSSTFSGGGLQVARSIVEECELFDQHTFRIVLGPNLSKITPEAAASHVSLARVAQRPAERLRRLENPAIELARIERAFRPDVVLTTSGPAYWRPRAPHLMGFNLPHYLYPESPFFTKCISWSERMKLRMRGAVIRYFAKRDADAWVVQTDDVRRRLQQWLKADSIFTVHNTISRAFLNLAPTSKPFPKPNAGEPFRVLVLSMYHRHKNLELLNQICKILRELSISDVVFDVTLPDHDYTAIIHPEHRHLVRNLGVQRPEQCPTLYEQANMLFLPTLLECFSANYVESMCMQRPIVTTDLGFARTVCEDAALYFEPMNAGDALAKILEIKSSSATYAYLTTAGRKQLPRFGTASARLSEYIRLLEQLVIDKS